MRCLSFLTFALLIAAAYGQAKKDTLEVYIRKTLEEFKGKMKTGIPEIHMPGLDPLKIPLIPVHIKESSTYVDLTITDLLATGLSTFNVKNLTLDMATMTLSANITLPAAQAKAKYDLNGKVIGFIPLYGKGNAVFVINDLEIQVKTKINLLSGLQLDTFQIKISFSQVQAYLENILGGGDLGNVVNQIISSFGKIIFDSQRVNIQNALNGVIRGAINNELKKLNLGSMASPLRVEKYSAPASLTAYSEPASLTAYSEPASLTAYKATGNANSYFDTLLKNARPMLKKVDPLKLPYLKDGFKKKVLFVTFEGYAELNSGNLKGLSTLHRTGDVTLTTDEKSGMTTLSGNIGISNLQCVYQTTLFFMGIRATPILHGTINSVNVFAKVSINLKTGAKSLSDFKITGFSRPSITITNLPVLGQFAGFVINLAMTPISNALKTTLENEVKRILAEEIKKINL